MPSVYKEWYAKGCINWIWILFPAHSLPHNFQSLTTLTLNNFINLTFIPSFIMTAPTRPERSRMRPSYSNPMRTDPFPTPSIVVTPPTPLYDAIQSFKRPKPEMEGDEDLKLKKQRRNGTYFRRGSESAILQLGKDLSTAPEIFAYGRLTTSNDLGHVVSPNLKQQGGNAATVVNYWPMAPARVITQPSSPLHFGIPELYSSKAGGIHYPRLAAEAARKKLVRARLVSVSSDSQIADVH